MSIFGSLLQINNSLAQTHMPPHDPYEDAWDKDTVQDETHIDVQQDGAAWINNAKDRTHSIISNLDTQAHRTAAPHVAADEAPAQLQNFYDSETFTARFGEESDSAADQPKHTTPTITEGQQSDYRVCSCCHLPREPGNYSSSSLPSPILQNKLKKSDCECFCPDAKMPREGQDSPPSIKPHIRRRSSLSAEGLAQRKKDGRAEMSVSAWL